MLEKTITEVEIFKGLTKQQVEELYSWMERRDFPASVEILKEGEVTNGLYMLCSGKVRVVKSSTKGRFKLDEITAPSFFGEVALLDRSMRSATVRTETEVTTGFLPSEVFETKVQSNNLTALRISLNLGRILSRRFRSVTRHLAIRTGSLKDSPGG